MTLARHARGTCESCGQRKPLFHLRLPYRALANLTTGWNCARCRAVILLALRNPDPTVN